MRPYLVTKENHSSAWEIGSPLKQTRQERYLVVLAVDRKAPHFASRRVRHVKWRVDYKSGITQLR